MSAPGRRRRRNPASQAFLGLFLLLVAAGLAVYAWATRGDQPQSEDEATDTVVWDAGDATVREIVIEGEHGRIVLRPGPPPELVASPDAPFGGQGPMAADTIGGLLSSRRWWMHEPGPYPLAEEYATTLVDGLRRLTAQRRVAEGVTGQALEQYGLHRPTVRVTVRFTGQDEARVLELGAESPVTGGGTYGRRAGQDAVYLLSPGLTDTLKMAPDALRETMFVPFEDDRVQRVELEWDGARLVFVRQEGGTSWSMERDGRRVGTQDDSQLSELWFALHQWRAADFVSDQGDEPAVRARHGLDAPYGRIRLEFQAAPGQKAGPHLEIRVGGTADEGGRYVMTNEGPWIYRLDPDDLAYFEDQVLPRLREPATGGGQGQEGDAAQDEGEGRGAPQGD